MDLLDSTAKMFEDCLAIMKAKNQDYAGKSEAGTLKNFNYSAQLANITRDQGILVRLGDKMTRIGNLLVNEAAVKDEAIEDTLKDAINYTAILFYSIKEGKNGEN